MFQGGKKRGLLEVQRMVLGSSCHWRDKSWLETIDLRRNRAIARVIPVCLMVVVRRWRRAGWSSTSGWSTAQTSETYLLIEARGSLKAFPTRQQEPLFPPLNLLSLSKPWRTYFGGSTSFHFMYKHNWESLISYVRMFRNVMIYWEVLTLTPLKKFKMSNQFLSVQCERITEKRKHHCGMNSHRTDLPYVRDRK